MSRTLKLFVFLCFIMIINVELYSQEKKDAFSVISINGGLLVNTNRNLIHKYWKPENGFYLQTETPFYYGHINLGVYYLEFKNKTDVPDFSNMFIYMGWGKEIELPLNLSITNGFKVGLDNMNFQTNSLSVYEKLESELAVSIYSKINFNLNSRVSFNITADLENIFTERRIKLFYLLGGVSYKFTSPVWLKDFLR